MKSIQVGIKIKQGGSIGGLHYLTKLDKLNRPTWAKEISSEVGTKIAAGANRFAPKSSGTLQKNAYLTTWGVNKEGSWIKVSVQNTNDVPYALYQYFGEIYGPNQAVWDLPKKYTKFSLMTNLKRQQQQFKHVGWISPKGQHKFPTGRMMGKRRTIETSKGFIHITGYTKNKRAKPKWLEVFMNSPRYWGQVTFAAEELLTTRAKELIEHGR